MHGYIVVYSFFLARDVFMSTISIYELSVSNLGKITLRFLRDIKHLGRTLSHR